MGFNGYFTKERLEGITLPFRLIGPALQILCTILIGLIVYIYINGQNEIKSDIEKYQRYIQASFKDLKQRVEINNDFVILKFDENQKERKKIIEDYRNWRELVEHRMTRIESKIRILK